MLGWVPYEDDPQQGKDRPVLVIAMTTEQVLCLMMTSKDHDRDAEDEARYGRYWMDIGTGGWDSQGRPSEVRLDRLITIPIHEIRREGAVLDQLIFDEVIREAGQFHTGLVDL